MKTMIKTTACLVALTAANITFASSNTVNDREDNVTVTQNYGTFQDDWKRERDEFRADVNRRIEKNQQRINELRAEAKNKKADAKEKYNEKINDLEKRNNKLKAKMHDYKDDTKDNWASFKREFNHDMDELGKAISDVFEDNKR
jgi:septal ring factor EnvC (AmiA/AmiB activator)